MNAIISYGMLRSRCNVQSIEGANFFMELRKYTYIKGIRGTQNPGTHDVGGLYIVNPQRYS